MPNACCVPNCKGNYKTGFKVSVFKFPVEAEKRRKWISAIKRENFQPSKNSRVCEKHFIDDDFVTEAKGFDESTGRTICVPLKVRRLKPDAVPSILPSCPSYLSSKVSYRPSADERKLLKEQAAISKALEESLNEKEIYDDLRSFKSLQELKDKLSLHPVASFWNVVQKESSVLFLNIETDPNPLIKHCVKVNIDLNITVHTFNVNRSKINKFNFPYKCSNINDLHDILLSVQNIDSNMSADNFNLAKDIINNFLKETDDPFLKFILEQLSLKCMKKKSYSSDMLIFSTLLHSLSPHAYKFLRLSEKLILPHPSTIQRICQASCVTPQIEQNEKYFLNYIKTKFNHLNSNDKVIIISLDEIHIKPFIDYKAGNIVGLSQNSSHLATSAHVFMVRSLTSSYKDVAHIWPVKTVNFSDLFSLTKKIILGLECIGFEALAIVSDNNSINRKTISQFSDPPKLSNVYPHPADPKRPLFYLIDSVHLLKSVRNNWLNQKNDGRCMFFPHFPGKSEGKFHTAAFSSLKQLHNCEINKLAKFSFQLTLKALAPSSLEKQNVKLALQIFSDFTEKALLELGHKNNISHYSDTSLFINIILTWWKIMNVKSPYIGQRLNDKFKFPLTSSPEDEKFLFLQNFLQWLKSWGELGCSTGMLTRETHSALTLTTKGILEITEYCKNKFKLPYILPGKFQTDDLEGRFSLYRQMSGSQYHISIRQVFESENKLRLQSVMKLGILSKAKGNLWVSEIPPQDEVDFDDLNEQADLSFLPDIAITDCDIEKIQNLVGVLLYIAGYCVYIVVKKIKCDVCKCNLSLDKSIEYDGPTNYFSNLDRGKLLFPVLSCLNVIVYNYIVIQKLCYDYEEEFVKCKNPRKLAMYISENVLVADDFFDNACENGHDYSKIKKMLLKASTNIFLNNYCSDKNDCHNKAVHSLAVEKQKKRKLKALAK